MFFYACAISANLNYFRGNKNPGKITKEVKDMTYEFDFTGLVPPYIDFELFEDINPKDKLNVYGEHPEKKETVKQLYLSKNKDGRRLIELFWDKENEHFLAVSRETALLKKQVGGRSRKIYFCSRCNRLRKSEKARDNHQNLCNGKKEIKFTPRNKNAGEVPKS